MGARAVATRRHCPRPTWRWRRRNTFSKVLYMVTLYRKYTWALTFEDFFFAGVHGACDEDLVRVSDVDEICSKYQ